MPTCPKCSKLVYAAEQIIGPGRKLYHKPCLTCTTCNRRLETSTLLEHDLEPYCKPCHLKNFGTRDLRHANLPHAQPPSTNDTSNNLLLRPSGTGRNPLPRLKPNRSLASPTFIRGSSPTSPASTPSENNKVTTPINDNTINEEEETQVHHILMPDNNDPPKQGQDQDQHVLSQSTSSPYPSNTGRPGIGTIPRTIPLYLNSPSGSRTGNKHYTSHSVGSLPSNYSPTNQEGEDVEQDPATKNLTASLTNRGNFTPLMQTSTGTRYGLALSGGVGVHATGYASPSPRKWGAVTPLCPRCMKNVYFAEQVKAVGKTFHKTCLKCVECGTFLYSNKLVDHDGDPFCVNCHNKLYGPQGNGYALLGKVGG